MGKFTLITNQQKQTGNYIFSVCIEFESTKTNTTWERTKQQTEKSKQLY